MQNKNLLLIKLFVLTIVMQMCIGEINAKSASALISSKMNKIATKFSTVYSSIPDVPIPGTLAVFPFQADAKLAKRKVDFAVGEIFSRQLIATGSFKIVERMSLQKILEEQSLSLTGVIETDSAVEIGKLLGAELLVMGSITHMGKTYHINIRMVDAETGEIISMDFIEVDVKVFEEEAKPYIVLVPEKQAIGIHLMYALINPFSVTVGPSRTFSGSYSDPEINYSATVTPADGDVSSFPGMGVRYFPASWLALEGAVFQPFKYRSGVVTEWDSPTNDNHWLDLNLSIKIMQLGMSYTRKLSERFRVYTGMQLYRLEIRYWDDSTDFEPLSASDNYPLTLARGKKSDLLIPMARLGIEWKPQARFGLALFGNVGLGSKESDCSVQIGEAGIETGTITEIHFATIKSPAFYLEMSLAFYF